jgi:hypothetical protein
MKKTLLLCLSVAVLAITVHGCGSSQAPPPEVHMVYLDPGFDSMDIGTVAILPLANTTGETDAEKILGNAIEGLIATRSDYSFMTAQRLRRQCQASGLSSDLESLRRQWVHAKTFKPDLARKLANELEIDAFLVGEVTKWDKVDLPATQSGYPHSDVGCRMLLMHARTGKKLWEGLGEKMVRGPYFDPTQEEITGYIDEAGIARGSGGKPIQMVEAPAIREVAGQVATDLVRAIPKKADEKKAEGE